MCNRYIAIWSGSEDSSQCNPYLCALFYFEVKICKIILKYVLIWLKLLQKREKFQLLAIKKASKRLKRWNLSDCDMYITLKPCSMCVSVIKQARLRNIFYLYDKLDYKKEYDKCNFIYKKQDFLSDVYGEILSSFFTAKR